MDGRSSPPQSTLSIVSRDAEVSKASDVPRGPDHTLDENLDFEGNSDGNIGTSVRASTS